MTGGVWRGARRPLHTTVSYASQIDREPDVPAVSARQLRALAHPLRIQLLQVLRTEGPSTATQLARRLGESSGATSYHLRALHKAGLIEEDERPGGRERWWRRPESLTVIPNSIDPSLAPAERAELQAAHAQLEGVFLDRDDDAWRRWQSIRYELPLEWQDANWLGNVKVWGTPEEIRELIHALLEATDRLRMSPERRSPGAREVHVTLRVLPQELDAP